MKNGIELIAEERARQIEKEGWTPEHDSQWANGELAKAAYVYERVAANIEYGHTVDVVATAWRTAPEWPWSSRALKVSSDPVRNHVKAGALYLAEKERLERCGGHPPLIESMQHRAEQCAAEIDRLQRLQD